jgi:predicted transcriptional regulator
MVKPRVFIASSSESLEAAGAVNVNLEHECEPTLWTHAFTLASTAIESLVYKSSAMDFAIFIFAPDDLSNVRGASVSITRDNVVFELGLFIGAIGRERCFIIKPRHVELHLPSDLLGISTADYDDQRSDGDLAQAMTPACVKIKKIIKELGMLTEVVNTVSTKNRINFKEINIDNHDFKVLSSLLRTHNDDPEGLSLSEIFKNKNSEFIHLNDNLSIIKLVKAGYIDKSISQYDYDGSDYYSYTITSDGVEYIIDNKDSYFKSLENNSDPIPF